MFTNTPQRSRSASYRLYNTLIVNVATVSSPTALLHKHMTPVYKQLSKNLFSQCTVARWCNDYGVKLRGRWLDSRSFRFQVSMYPGIVSGITVGNIVHIQSRLQNTSKVPKMVHGLRCLSYEQRLRHLERTTLKERRIRGDLIETFKIMTRKRRG